MAAIFYDAVSSSRSYSVYGLKKSGFPSATDIIGQGQNPGFKVGDTIQWVSYDKTKTFIAKIIFYSFDKYSAEYPIGYYILSVNRLVPLTFLKLWGGQIRLVPYTPAIEDSKIIDNSETNVVMAEKKPKKILMYALFAIAAFLVWKEFKK